MSDLDKVVRLPLYNAEDGMDTGEQVEIPLVLLKQTIRPLAVFNQKLRIIPPSRER